MAHRIDSLLEISCYLDSLSSYASGVKDPGVELFANVSTERIYFFPLLCRFRSFFEWTPQSM